MIRILLSPHEVECLEHVLRASDDPQPRTRVQFVLMAHRGRPQGQIACDTGTSRSSVRRWLNAYTERGLDALRPRKPGKPHPKLADDPAPVSVVGSSGAAGPRAAAGQLDPCRAGRAPLP